MKRVEIAGYEVFCGIDVGKESHCARALAPDGETELLDWQPLFGHNREGLLPELNRAHVA